ncbi:hypothetical protein OLX02_01695 [Novosphingobium sp. KCTC 2891]|uniref:hypothetical protein n=1 Tax=Novosphingobium sp. KCTC 2891 TaxID=2989730 RepID=UPI002221D7D2|nr:hypothetical protein [Novosphingobium sp. KCTC 2891]MCW1381526.1 hypothetical protein [Novosphingobium sp. KCTC 2891]
MEHADNRFAPAHLWVVGTISLLWNAFGCLDYLQTQLGMVQMPPEVAAYVAGLPGWLTGFWALGVWGSLVGSILLLLRSRHAVTAFALSLLGLAVSQGTQMLTHRPAEMSGQAMAVFTALIWGVLIFLIVYARRMRVAGVLR